MWETSAHFFLKKKINDEKKIIQWETYSNKLISTKRTEKKEQYRDKLINIMSFFWEIDKHNVNNIHTLEL